MAGLWDGVPASPCSGASDDMTVRQGRSTVGKRTRFSSRRPFLARPYSPDVEVGFKEASTMSKPNRDSELVSKLNHNAADERRKMLLQKLRAIDQKKAQLRRVAASPPPQAPGASVDLLSSVIEAATPEPIDVDAFESSAVPARRPSRRVSHAVIPSETRERKGKGKLSKARPPSLALDAALKGRDNGSVMDIERFASCSSPSPTATTTCGSPRASPSPVPGPSPVLTHADLPSRTRSSRRVTRPRTPSVLLKGMPGETVLSKLPVGVLKCKRYQYCKKVVSALLKNPSAGPFSAPVSQLWAPDAIPRYFDVITKPMDLGTVKKNMEGTSYLNAVETNPLHMLKVEAFAEDVRQVFRNAMVYNNVGDMLYNCAEDLLEEFEVMIKNVPPAPSKEENRRKRQSSSQRTNGPGKRGRIGELPSSRFSKANTGLFTAKKTSKPVTGVPGKKPAKAVSKKTVPPAIKSRQVSKTSSDKPLTIRQVKRRLEYYKKCRVALRARTPLPKGATFYDRAALIHDVDMTYAEKSRMSEGIRRLPPTKLDTFLGIVRDATGGDDGRADEIELDINVLDTKTLRNIEAFLDMVLPNYKTIRNSDIGTEFNRVEDFEAEEKRLLVRVAEAKKRPQSSDAVDTSPRASFDRESEELYASSDSDSDSDSSDSDSSGSDSDSD